MTLRIPRSSTLARRCAPLILALAALPAAAAGQKPDSTKAAIDSLGARLERAEEMIEMLRQQLAAQGESSVKSKSGMTVELHGRVLMNAFANTRRTNNADVPFIVRSDTGYSSNYGGAGMTIRQTTLGLSVTSSHVMGAEFLGDLDVDFYGGQLANIGGRTLPLIRMRTARAVLTWPRAELLLGQEQPLVSNLNPVSLAGVGTPVFTAAGNTWYWMPQVRLTVERPGKVRWGVAGAILAPMTGESVGTFDTDFDAAERARRPYLEGRVRARWGEDESLGEIGLGYHVGWLSPARDSMLENHAVTLDALVPLGRHVEARGEWFSGQGMRVLGGGQVGQLYGRGGVVVRGSGGWGQVNVKPSPRLLLGAGYGFDDPRDADLPASGRLRNVSSEMHAIAHPGGPLVLSFEWRRMTTTYTARSWTNDHLNVGVGFEF
jgi:hypothetical protein